MAAGFGQPTRLVGQQSSRKRIHGAGTVKWFDVRKGFGFIAPDDGGSDAFVHISAVGRSGLGHLREGQKLGLDLVSDRKSGKASADNLKALD